MKHYNIGIDPSINSTGICVTTSTGSENIYYIISSNPTKKSLEYCAPLDYINIIPYVKSKPTDIYWEREQIKTNNIKNIVNEIGKIVDFYKARGVIDRVTMEGISYGSVKGSALVDLSFLNMAIRLQLNGLPLYIVSPKEVKKYAIGNGNSDKDIMVLSWKRLDGRIRTLPEWIKCDDLADAYFMANYCPNGLTEQL